MGFGTDQGKLPSALVTVFAGRRKLKSRKLVTRFEPEVGDRQRKATVPCPVPFERILDAPTAHEPESGPSYPYKRDLAAMDHVAHVSN